VQNFLSSTTYLPMQSEGMDTGIFLANAYREGNMNS